MKNIPHRTYEQDIQLLSPTVRSFSAQVKTFSFYAQLEFLYHEFLPLTLPLPKSDGTFFADVFIAMIVEMLDGGQTGLTEDTQVMICYATSTHTVGSPKKKDLGSARIARIEKKD